MTQAPMMAFQWQGEGEGEVQASETRQATRRSDPKDIVNFPVAPALTAAPPASQWRTQNLGPPLWHRRGRPPGVGVAQEIPEAVENEVGIENNIESARGKGTCKQAVCCCYRSQNSTCSPPSASCNVLQGHTCGAGTQVMQHEVTATLGRVSRWSSWMINPDI